MDEDNFGSALHVFPVVLGNDLAAEVRGIDIQEGWFCIVIAVAELIEVD